MTSWKGHIWHMSGSLGLGIGSKGIGRSLKIAGGTGRGRQTRHVGPGLDLASWGNNGWGEHRDSLDWTLAKKVEGMARWKNWM